MANAAMRQASMGGSNVESTYPIDTIATHNARKMRSNDHVTSKSSFALMLTCNDHRARRPGGGSVNMKRRSEQRPPSPRPCHRFGLHQLVEFCLRQELQLAVRFAQR